jgi:hypothetical protein
MLHIFSPELSHFEQPLSGEVCARAQVWENLLKINASPDGWGIDVWFLIESAMLGYNIKEVFMSSKDTPHLRIIRKIYPSYARWQNK